MVVKVLNEFLPPAEDIRIGAIKVGETLDIDNENVLEVNSLAVLGSYYSNVITEIPQDIKVELNTENHTIVLKAGSKVWYPDGFEADGTTPKFSYYILNIDRTALSSSSSSTYTDAIIINLYDESGIYMFWGRMIDTFSGTTAPAVTGNRQYWYDTVNNIIKYYDPNSSTWITEFSGHKFIFPIGLFTRTESVGFTSINQVFNGAGYIGHHAFILPGVKGLIADGKTEQGTVKSILKTVNKVIIRDLTTINDTYIPTYNNKYVYLKQTDTVQISDYYAFKSISELIPRNGFQYIYDTNYLYYKSNDSQSIISELPFIDVSVKDNMVTYFNILQPIRIAAEDDRIDTTGTFLFDYKWSDHIPNKLSWVDANTFSWQDGNVFKAAYEELLTAWNGEYTSRTDQGITYRDTAKGYQIAGPDQESNIISAWNTYRTGWYYILDTVNKRFKLPRLGSLEIVEKYKSGNNWYRIYADDWIEQGGRYSASSSAGTYYINLLIKMRDTSYSVDCSQNQVQTSDWTANTSFNQYSTSQLKVSQRTTVAGNMTWIVYGYIPASPATLSTIRQHKHLYFYLGYTDLDELQKGEVDINLVTDRSISRVNAATEEGINRLNTDSNALNRTQITNCITEIPQDIKLELDNGSIIIKAGSKVYIPDGFESNGTTPKFTVYTYETDHTCEPPNSTNSFYLFPVIQSNSQRNSGLSATFSGASAPTLSAQYAVWYDTTNNKIKLTNDTGSSWLERQIAFPICIETSTVANSVSSIDQVFNGFGYIGQHMYVLPGVKGLIPNGRNADGSLNNKTLILNNIAVYDTSSRTIDHIFISQENIWGWYFTDVLHDNYTTPAAGTWKLVFDTNKNRWYASRNGAAYVETDAIDVGYYEKASQYVFSAFKTNTVFTAVDRNGPPFGAIKGPRLLAVEKTNSTASTWTSSYDWVAPCNCWVELYLSGIVTSDQTRAGAIEINGYEVARNGEYKAGRDFAVGPMYVAKGQKVAFKFVEATNAKLWYIAAY